MEVFGFLMLWDIYEQAYADLGDIDKSSPSEVPVDRGDTHKVDAFHKITKAGLILACLSIFENTAAHAAADTVSTSGVSPHNSLPSHSEVIVITRSEASEQSSPITSASTNNTPIAQSSLESSRVSFHNDPVVVKPHTEIPAELLTPAQISIEPSVRSELKNEIRPAQSRDITIPQLQFNVSPNQEQLNVGSDASATLQTPETTMSAVNSTHSADVGNQTTTNVSLDNGENSDQILGRSFDRETNATSPALRTYQSSSTIVNSQPLPEEATPQVRVLLPAATTRVLGADGVPDEKVSIPIEAGDPAVDSRSKLKPQLPFTSTSIANSITLPEGAVPLTRELLPQRLSRSSRVIPLMNGDSGENRTNQARSSLIDNTLNHDTPVNNTVRRSAASDLSNSTSNNEVISPFLYAQNRPNQPGRDRFPQETPSPVTPAPVPVVPIPETPEEPQLPPSEGQEDITLYVNRIDVTGNSILDEAIQEIIQPLEERTVSLSELQRAERDITTLYVDQGYLTSRAELRPQTVEDGVVQIHVLENRIEEIVVEGTETLNPNYISSRVALGSDTPLNVNDLEDQLRLLLADPILANVRPTLKPSDDNQSILVVEVEEANLSQITFGFDNYSPPLVGSERLGLNGRFLNLTGAGDRLLTSYYRSTTGGADVFDIGFQIPLNPMNGTLKIGLEDADDNITQSPLDELDINGSSERYDISYRQPLIRSPEEEFALTLGLTHQRGQTFISDQPIPFGIGPDEDGVSRTSVIGFGQDYTLRDTKGAWSFRSQFSLGTDLFDATQNSGDIPDGQFFSWLGQAQRLQVLDENQLLVAKLDLQLTPDSLLSSERFVIGGGQSVRGYRQNVRSGDNGFRLSVENRITLLKNKPWAEQLIVAPFIDMGAVWNSDDNPSQIPDQQFLIGAGVGVLWEPVKNLNLRLDYGFPFIDLRDRGDNIQDDGLYFSLGYSLEF